MAYKKVLITKRLYVVFLILGWLLSFGIGLCPIQAQTPCLTNKVLTLQGAQISTKADIQKQVENWLRINGSFPEETNEITVPCLKNSNRQIEAEKHNIEITINDFISQKNQLIENKDIIALAKQLDDKTKSLADIKKEFIKQLADLSVQGVYFVLLNRDRSSGLSADALLNEAKNFVVAQALSDLNGVFIKMIQTSVNENGLSSYSETITQNISGSFEIEPSFVQREDVNGFNQKLFIITVKVSPLKRKVSNQNIAQAPAGTRMLSKDMGTILSTLQFINEEQKERIISKTEEFQGHCKEVNLATERQKISIITNYKNKIINIDDEIATLQRKLERTKEVLRGVIEGIGVVYNASNLAASISSAEQAIQKKIESMKQDLIEKTKQIWDFPQVSKVIFDAEKPVEDIALQIQSAKERLDKAGLITLYNNTQQLNQQGFKETTAQSIQVKRTVNVIWVVLVPKSTFWEVVISAQYNLVKQVGGVNSTVNSNEKTNTEENQNNNTNNNNQPIETFTVNGYSFEMVAVKGGTFTMGCTAEQGSDCEGDEKPAHQVSLDDYYMGKYEVTQGLWEAVMGSNPSYNKSGANYPVEQVNWDDCQEFIMKLNSLTGKNFRLPTEAEWEYAARGGRLGVKFPSSGGLSAGRGGFKYAGSDDIDEVGWYDGNIGSSKKTHAVGTKMPNALGLYDMSGNVWELCRDYYFQYSSESVSNPKGPSSGDRRVLRGGGWGNGAQYGRVSNRGADNPRNRSGSNGFRLAYSSSK